MSACMDMYLSVCDSVSFQDMLDIDIKSEIESLVGGHNDFSGFNFTDFASPLDVNAADVPDIKWFSSASNHSSSSLNLDFSGGSCGGEDRTSTTTMVNPNAVMPVMSITASSAQGNFNHRSPSPSMLKESHLTFSPATIKIASIKQENAMAAANSVKKDLIRKLEDVAVAAVRAKAAVNSSTSTTESKPVTLIKTISKVTPIMAKPQNMPTKTHHNHHHLTKGTPALLTFKNTVCRQTNTPLTVAQITNVTTATTVRTVSTTTGNQQTSTNNNSNHISNNRLKLTQNGSTRFYEDSSNNCSSNTAGDMSTRIFPKPTYSYSCLIAMALKNSRSGSLPVSEIYNFMCRHFPYFNTAPNGWKNSVRHNLSLNKCFEKIEKPAVNGAQRKGCLWAMNPAKISKMDEEVQKWSRKDPSAIRRAMVNPENLESLERGELKFTCSYDEEEGTTCGEETPTHHPTYSSGGAVGIGSGASCSGSDSGAEDDDEEEEGGAASSDDYEFESNQKIEFDYTMNGVAVKTTSSATEKHGRQGQVRRRQDDRVDDNNEDVHVKVDDDDDDDEDEEDDGDEVSEEEEDSELDVEVRSDLDVEEYMYEDMEDDKKMLRQEMELAQKDLMKYERTLNNKRRRTYIVNSF